MPCRARRRTSSRPCRNMTNITQTNPGSVSGTRFKKFTWYNLSDNGEAEIAYLRENFDFSPRHLRDCATPPLRPKIETNDHYIFLILLFPVFNRQTRAISAAELDVFLGRDFLITVHQNEIAALKDFVECLETETELAGRYQGATTLKLLLDILEETTASLYPMLNHVAWDIDELDKQLFSGQERALLNSILTIKRNIVDIRKAVRSHSHVFSQLADQCVILEGARPGRATDRIHSSVIPAQAGIHNDDFSKLISHSADIWDQLENHKATIDAIQETNESLISFQISSVMKTLTIFSVIIFPLTLLAAIFGMDAKGGMPFVNSAYGFWKALGVLATVMLGMLYYFKRKRWL